MGSRIPAPRRRSGRAGVVFLAAALLIARASCAAGDGAAVAGTDAAIRERPAGEAARAPVDEVCSAGSFETRPEAGGFDILYTNLSAQACRSVPYYCLWGMVGSTGFYRQSATGAYQGLVGPGETLRIATVEPAGGPADREVAWSWCITRR